MRLNKIACPNAFLVTSNHNSKNHYNNCSGDMDVDRFDAVEVHDDIVDVAE